MKITLIISALLTLVSCNKTLEQNHKDLSLNQIINTNEDVLTDFIEVPENRSKKNGKKIELAYTVIKALNKNSKKAPLVYLQGGPGGPTLIMENAFKNTPYHNDRDIILMDQRGTGISNAICADYGNNLIQVLAKDLSPEEEYRELRKILVHCKMEATSKNIDLSAYNSRENAADFEDLRKHLGYDQFNLFGESYGSRLGLTIMRDFPKSVRSAILTGVFPPEINFYENLVGNFKQSLFEVFKVCDNDADCNTKYPDIKTDFLNVINLLNKEPYTFKFNNGDFVLNTQDVLLMLHQMLYRRSTIEQIPSFIKAIETKNDDVIRNSLRPAMGTISFINFAMYMSVNAYDELAFNGVKESVKDLKNNSELIVAPAYFGSDARLLEEWHSFRAKPYENKPVISNIPTLIANGRLDPITPPGNALLAAKHLENSFYIEFEADGHGVSFTPCFFEFSLEFLDNPEVQPDFSCVNMNTDIQWK
ncbi:alpha/beta fold hydrolase [Flavobacteriaceae bacterium R38]|nr:alpha/beta fold hydrolase [Flavobacteriaceae bacterium R38]